MSNTPKDKEFFFLNQKISYTLRHSARARRIRLAVYGNGSVVLTSPLGTSEYLAERFMREKAIWLVSKVHFFANREQPTPLFQHLTRRDYLKYKPRALVFVMQKVEEINRRYGYTYHRISVKNQKTCWGSCSRTGNLNFNYKILFLPERAQDYVIAHEICHLKEFNHSKKFWALIAQTSPEYREIRRELKRGRFTPLPASPADARVS